eukprot:3020739-Prymnesium_polylepis.3
MPADLRPYAAALKQVRENNKKEQVCEAAAEAFGKLGADDPAQIAPAVIAKLEHSDAGVRMAAMKVLGKAGAYGLTQLVLHTPALVAILDVARRDENVDVRMTAFGPLSQLEADVLEAARAAVRAAAMAASSSTLVEVVNREEVILSFRTFAAETVENGSPEGWDHHRGGVAMARRTILRHCFPSLSPKRLLDRHEIDPFLVDHHLSIRKIAG